MTNKHKHLKLLGNYKLKLMFDSISPQLEG